MAVLNGPGCDGGRLWRLLCAEGRALTCWLGVRCEGSSLGLHSAYRALPTGKEVFYSNLNHMQIEPVLL